MRNLHGRGRPYSLAVVLGVVTLTVGSGGASADHGETLTIEERWTEFSIVEQRGDDCTWEATIAWTVVNATDQTLTITAVDYYEGVYYDGSGPMEFMTVTTVDLGGLAPGMVLAPSATDHPSAARVQYTIPCDIRWAGVYVRATTDPPGHGYGRVYAWFTDGSELPIGQAGGVVLAFALAVVMATRHGRRGVRAGTPSSR